jgi:hypothetical protein
VRRVRCAVIVAVVALLPRPSTAHPLLSELLLQLLFNEIILTPAFGHEAHFRPILGTGDLAPGFDVSQIEIPLAINSVIASQLSTLPLGSSSGGFSYTFDPALGTFERQSNSFGSPFAERALTAGRGRWNLGFNFQHASYDTLEGKDLDGGVEIYLVHQDCCAPTNTSGAPPEPFFEGDIIRNRLSLDLRSSTFASFINYGVTDRLDVGVVVPIVTIEMNASVRSTIINLGTQGVTSIVHAFEGGAFSQTFSDSARAQGLGDVVFRGKYRLFDAAGGGIAAGVDLRLPTGDSGQLLGAGGVLTKVAFIGSMAAGNFSPHANVGYTFSSVEEPEPLSVDPLITDEFAFAAGFDMSVTPRITVSSDIVGRSLLGLGRLVPGPRNFTYTTITGAFGSATFEEFTRQPGDLTQVAIALGTRFNPRGNLLFSASVLMPITSSGLRDRITPVIGLDYSF